MEGNGLTCYRQVNDSDIMSLLEMSDPIETAQHTVDRIKSDFNRISGVYSVNCVFRYLVYSQRNEFDEYLKTMSALGSYCGLVGFGEHFNGQFVNQTMTCVVFE